MSPLNLSIPPDLGTRVQSFVDSGRYSSGADVVRAALDALEMQISDLDAIRAGFADIGAGRCRPFEEFAADFENRKEIQ